jgi:hypothetical protein
MCLGPYVLEGLDGLVALAWSSGSLLIREGEQNNGEPRIVIVNKSGASPAALQARSGQDISAVERMAFPNVRLSPIYEHCFNDCIEAWRLAGCGPERPLTVTLRKRRLPALHRPVASGAHACTAPCLMLETVQGMYFTTG